MTQNLLKKLGGGAVFDGPARVCVAGAMRVQLADPEPFKERVVITPAKVVYLCMTAVAGKQ